MAALLWLFLRGQVFGRIGAAAAWLVADWHRVLIVLALCGYVATYVVADHRRAAADAIVLKARIDQLTNAFEQAAAAAEAAERQRQTQAGADATAAFDQQQAARDAADAAKDAQLQKEIADAEEKLTATGGGCDITDDDLSGLRPAAGAQPAAAARRR